MKGRRKVSKDVYTEYEALNLSVIRPYEEVWPVLVDYAEQRGLSISAAMRQLIRKGLEELRKQEEEGVDEIQADHSAVPG